VDPLSVQVQKQCYEDLDTFNIGPGAVQYRLYEETVLLICLNKLDKVKDFGPVQCCKIKR
jgi:hypothetical protein